MFPLIRHLNRKGWKADVLPDGRLRVTVTEKRWSGCLVLNGWEIQIQAQPREGGGLYCEQLERLIELLPGVAHALARYEGLANALDARALAERRRDERAERRRAAALVAALEAAP